MAKKEIDVFEKLKKEAIRLLKTTNVESINIYDWSDSIDIDIKLSKKNLK